MLAAKAVAEVSPTAGTVQDVLADHAFGHYAQGLRQYLVIRTGSVDDGLAAFAKLRDQITDEGTEQLLEPPGIRARLYRRAREIAPPAPLSMSKNTLGWFKPATQQDEYRTAVARIRSSAPESDRELLELRYARELGMDEIAYVLDCAEDDVRTDLDDALKRAQKRFARGDKGLPKALLEAFALEDIPEPSSDDGEDDEKKAALALLGTVLGERYELVQHIGAGGFADVYRATDVAVPGHVVALKLLRTPSSSKRSREASLKELRIIASVYHPSIVQFKDHGWYEQRLWFVMPWYDGDVLESRLETEPLSRAKARQIFPQLARALATLHAAEIRHQDIKPDNIFLAELKGFGLEEDVLPVLLDLGVAAKDAELVVAGTPTYFAPEVAAQFAYREGDEFPSSPIGSAADVYGLALSLRNALEPDTQPRLAGGAIDTFIRTRAAVPVEPPESKELQFLRPHFRRWLAMDPAERPTADQFADELAVLTEPEEKRERRMRLLRIFGPLALALLTIFGVIVWELNERTRIQREEAAIAQREAALSEEKAAEALADLEDATNDNTALEEEVRAAQERIESSQLSRSQLESQLGTAEARAARTLRILQETRKAVQSARLEIAAGEERVERLTRQVSTLERTGAERQSQLESARAELGRAQSDLRAARADATLAQSRVSEATLARDRATSAQANAEARVATAERAQARAEQDLTRSLARIRQLEADLARARRTPTVTPMTTVPNVPSVMTPDVTPTTPTRMEPRRITVM